MTVDGISESVLEFFTIELVQLHQRLYKSTSITSTTATGAGSSYNLLSLSTKEPQTTTTIALDSVETIYSKLESLGYRTGLVLADVSTLERHRFTDTLDIIKFICKDIWMSVFKKQIDNLKTNHRVRGGVMVFRHQQLIQCLQTRRYLGSLRAHG